MVEPFKIVFLLVLCFALIVYGSIAVKQKHVSIGFGRGQRPLFVIPLIGIGAVVFGVIGICGGLITLIPTIMFLSSGDDVTLETAMTVGIATALVITSGGFVVGAIIQFLKALERNSGTTTKKD